MIIIRFQIKKLKFIIYSNYKYIYIYIYLLF